MASVSHFICGMTGSNVCLNCFVCVACVDSLGDRFGAASGVCLLSVHIFLGVVGHVVWMCGHMIFWKLTCPIALACALPSMMGPTVLVTLNMVWNALLLM